MSDASSGSLLGAAALYDSYRYGDGRWHDELLWARLAEDPPPSPCQDFVYTKS